MNFWQTIENSRVSPLNIDQMSQSLERSLQESSEEDLRAFCEAFDQCMDQAYTWELWGFAYLANGGCSDDTFMDFRASLVALGEDVFASAVADAESLLSLDESEIESMFEEGFLYVGPSVLKEKFGTEPNELAHRKQDPSGIEWEETRESLMQRFPRAWERYGWEEPSQEPTNTKPPAKPWWKFW